jgi:Ca2+-binding RTX toxin-like protein
MTSVKIDRGPAGAKRRICGKATAVLCAAVIAGVASPAAHGGTLSASQSGSVVTATYEGSAGEANNVTFHATTMVGGPTEFFTRVRLTDEGAPVAAGRGCETVDAHTARCDFPLDSANVNIRLFLEDGPDEATAAGACDSAEDLQPTCEITIDGGDGNDRLRGGETDGRVLLRGRLGDDRLVGDPWDRLSGGGGRDRLVGANPFFGDNDPIFARGGPGADVIYGSHGDDVLSGGRGRDLLRGGRGKDVLDGGRGRDLIRGSRGNDRMCALDGVRDRVRGGLGYDRARVDRRDVVAGVERVS